MSETIPQYIPVAVPPPNDIPMLRSKIAMYLRSGAGDSQARDLLEKASTALLDGENGLLARIARALEISEARISDGK